MIKKSLAVVLSALLLLPMIVAAVEKPEIKTLYFLGKGIAVSPTNPLEFKMVKIGAAHLQAELAGETTELRVGVLFLDEEKYKLRELTVLDGKATGKVYLNDTEVGSFDLTSVMKGDIEVWAGTLTVSGVSYHLYILEAPRKMNQGEIGEKVRDYCKENPEDTDCRERTQEYCNNNPEDARCKEIIRRQCQQNLDDSRCREFMLRYCKERPLDATCRVFAAKRTAEFCEENSDSKICETIDKALEKNCEDKESGECKTFCEQYPNRCRLVKAVAARVTAQTAGQAGEQNQVGPGGSQGG